MYFAAVVDAGSFTAAAERLGITKAVVSQQVVKLEDELKVSLLTRTTRRVSPTEAGRRLHARSVLILKEAEDALGEITESSEPTGNLRISAPNDYGTSVLAPLVASFLRRYPACTVDLMLSDSRLDIVANQIDLSIRVGWLTDSSLLTRRIGGFRQLLVASTDLASHIRLSAPKDLVSQPFVANGALREPHSWAFSRGNSERVTVLSRSTLTIDATPAVLAATLAGAGISVLPDYLAQRYLSEGTLVHLLPEWSLPVGGIHLVYPALRFRPPKVHAFSAMLMERQSK